MHFGHRGVVLVLLLSTAVLALITGCAPGGSSSHREGTNGDTPSQLASDEQDPGVRTRAFLKEHGLEGRVALIEFGIIGCGKSEEGLKRMIALHRDKTIPGLAFARVEALRDKPRVDEYYKAKAPKFPVVHDPDTTLARAFRATTYPAFVIVDRYGHIRYRGKYPEQKLASWVETLAAETEDPGPDAPLLGVVELDIAKLLEETKLPDLGGTKVKLGDCAGKGGLFLLFVDTSCPYSALALNDYPQVAKTLAERDIKSVVVNIGDPGERVRRHYKGRDIARVLWDATLDTGHAWDIHAVPTAVYIHSGSAVYRGLATWSELGAAVETALSLPAGSVEFSGEGTEHG